ncbi:MAG: OmpA family protein [Candidatus Kapabacteria bacterium]|jgi:outer membrane protein OmpA-like peptidoglycan-associated protein|nr:OmpA family protein [Candidatus Kapabacteria bacterium]
MSAVVTRLPLMCALLLFLNTSAVFTQQDSLTRARRQAEEAKINANMAGLRLTIQNVDISRFPRIKLIVEVLDDSSRTLDTINPKLLTVVENGQPKPVESIEKITITERIPVDFMFLVDVTGTMQAHINGVKNNIESFVESLRNRGIEYRIGLVLFSDIIEKVYPPTSDVKEFNSWLSKVFAAGGFDEKENALEAILTATKAKWNPAANRVLVLITDAPYHQFGERGNGRTYLTTEATVTLLKEQSIRLFAIAPMDLPEYKVIADATRGAVFNIKESFAKILDQYSTQLTNLYAITYRSDAKMVRDSINVSILDEKKRELVRQIIPIVEIGRKFIIENLLFPSSSSVLPDSVAELDVLTDFMKSRPAVNVRVEGHTDNKGSMAVNKALSLQRAESVKAYLVQRGIAAERVETKGFGPARPIGDNATEFGRSLNRRTEIVITAK